MKVLFIGSDPRIVEVASLGVRLRWPDVEMLVVSQALEGVEMVEQELPDVVLLHPDFTDVPLAEAIQDLRAFSNVPLLVLGRQGDEMEVITSLEAGADDHLRMPCNLTELTIRIWALLRRAGTTVCYETESPMTSGPLMVNPATYEAYMGRHRIPLTNTEFRLLYLLVKNWGMVVSRQSLERGLCGEQVDSSGLVKKYVQRLRQKLGDNAREPIWIASVHGVGYRFIGPAPKSHEYNDDFSHLDRATQEAG